MYEGWLERLTRPWSGVRDPAERSRVRLLRALLLASVPLTLVVAALWGLSRGEVTALDLTLTGITLPVAAGMWLLSGTRWHRPTPWIYQANAIVVPLAGAWLDTDPLRIHGLVTFVSVGVLFSAFLLPRRASVLVVLLSFAAGTLVALFHPLMGLDAAYLSVGVLGFVSVYALLATAHQSRSLAALRKTAERLKSSEAAKQLLIDNGFDAVVVVDVLGRILRVSDGASELFGVGEAEPIGEEVATLFAPKPGSSGVHVDLDGLLDRAQERAGRSFQIRGQHTSGTQFPCEISLWPSDASFTLFVRDMTEQREAETELRLRDRLSTLGTMVAGVVHEVNNPLAYVRANLEQLDVRNGLPEHHRRAVAHALEGTRRIEMVVHDLKTFGLPHGKDAAGALAPDEAVELGSVIESSIAMAGPTTRHRVRIETDIEAVPLVRGNGARLGQVFLNLLVNAAQAMPERQPDMNIVRIAAKRDGDRVVVTIRDNGVGVPPDMLDAIFDPFVTTKGDGTGLGLAICRNIVNELGGSIAIESTPNAGTQVVVSLPVDAAKKPVELHPARVDKLSGIRVLIIDDEPALLEALDWMLEDFQTKCCHDARAALELHEAAPFDVILCDMMMPGFDGRDVLVALRRKHPGHEARLVFMSGGAIPGWARDYPCLAKPFGIREVREVVTERAAAVAAARVG